MCGTKEGRGTCGTGLCINGWVKVEGSSGSW